MILLFFSLKKVLQLSDKLDQIEDLLQDSAVLLDDIYQRLKSKSEIELFSDEPIIKELVYDMMQAKEVVNKIVNSFEVEDEKDTEDIK